VAIIQAANVALWFASLLKESRHRIEDDVDDIAAYFTLCNATLMETKGNNSDSTDDLLAEASVWFFHTSAFLYPITIEFSLLMCETFLDKVMEVKNPADATANIDEENAAGSNIDADSENPEDSSNNNQENTVGSNHVSGNVIPTKGPNNSNEENAVNSNAAAECVNPEEGTSNDNQGNTVDSVVPADNRPHSNLFRRFLRYAERVLSGFPKLGIFSSRPNANNNLNVEMQTLLPQNRDGNDNSRRNYNTLNEETQTMVDLSRDENRDENNKYSNQPIQGRNLSCPLINGHSDVCYVQYRLLCAEWSSVYGAPFKSRKCR